MERHAGQRAQASLTLGGGEVGRPPHGGRTALVGGARPPRSAVPERPVEARRRGLRAGRPPRGHRLRPGPPRAPPLPRGIRRERTSASIPTPARWIARAAGSRSRRPAVSARRRSTPRRRARSRRRPSSTCSTSCRRRERPGFLARAARALEPGGLFVALTSGGGPRWKRRLDTAQERLAVGLGITRGGGVATATARRSRGSSRPPVSRARPSSTWAAAIFTGSSSFRRAARRLDAAPEFRNRSPPDSGTKSRSTGGPKMPSKALRQWTIPRRDLAAGGSALVRLSHPLLPAFVSARSGPGGPRARPRGRPSRAARPARRAPPAARTS